MHWLRDMTHSLRASPVFAFAVLLTLALAGFNALMVVLMNLARDLLPGGFAQMGHFTDLSHRTHDLTLGFLFLPAVVGMLAQLRRPSKNVAGQLMALIPWVGLVLAGVLTFVFPNKTPVLTPPWANVAAAALIATILHPAGRDLLRSFSVARVDRVMLALVIIAAAPLLAFAATNIGLQGTIIDDHALMGHYRFMAAFGLTVLGVGLLASLRPDGWWLPAWVAGFLPVLLGLTSMIYPDVSSSLGLFWALAAITWGVGFVAVAELNQEAERPTLLGAWGVIPTLRGPRRVLSMDHASMRPADEPPRGTARWLNVLGILVLVPLVLVVGQNWARIAGGLEGPGGGDFSGLHGPDTAPIAGAPVLAITAENFAFSPARIELGVGQPAVNIALTSVDIPHDLVVDEIGFHLTADRGATAIGGLNVRSFGVPGTYVGYCSVPGHREAGMEIEIVVTAPGGRQH